MQRKNLHAIASISAVACLLVASFLILGGGTYTRAAPAGTGSITSIQDAAVDLSAGYSQEAGPGTTITYTHMITNSGTTSDTFALEVTSSNRWPVALLEDYSSETALPPLELSAGLSSTFVVSLSVPASTSGGVVEHTIVTATSSNNIAIQDTLVDTTTVKAEIINLPLVTRSYPPSWHQAGGTSGISFYDISVCPSNPLLQYAGTTTAGLYRSTDGGETWQHWALDGWTTPVTVNPLYCAESFATVWGQGVYRVTGQNQVVSINQGLDEPYLYGLAAVANGQSLYLYAGSSSHGVYRADASTANWTTINDGISDLRIRSLYVVSDTIYAGSRQCTYYFSDDRGNTWENSSILDGEHSGQCEDAQVWAIAQMDNLLFASLGGNKGVYLSNDGASWTSILDISGVTTFRSGLYPYQSHLYVGTYGQGVYTCDSSGHCQPLPNSELGTSNIRGLAVAETPKARLLAGSDDGIWTVRLKP